MGVGAVSGAVVYGRRGGTCDRSKGAGAWAGSLAGGVTYGGGRQRGLGKGYGLRFFFKYMVVFFFFSSSGLSFLF